METHLRRLVDEAGVQRALVIAGDRADPAGTLSDALAAIKSGVLQRCGLVEIGISGYPDGHPRMTDAQLAAGAERQARRRRRMPALQRADRDAIHDVDEADRRSG